jgi:hypothetical protein
MPQRWTHRLCYLASIALWLICATGYAWGQGTVPAPGSSCVVSAGNRNAPLTADGSYTIFGIPGNLGSIRARATCSDGTVGQSAAGFTDPFQAAVIELGPIVFGAITPVPVALLLVAPSRRINSGETSQFTTTAIGPTGQQTNVTPRSQGTTYTISNELLATVSENGLVRVFAEFAAGSSSRVLTSVTNEGSVTATYMHILGPRGVIRGTVLLADGTTKLANAQVSVLRLQPFEQAGTAVTDAQGRFELTDVNAGPFLVTAVNPITGDRAQLGAMISNEAQVVNLTLRLNGQGVIDVTVRDAADAPAANTEVTLTSLGAYTDVRLLSTNAQGLARFDNVPAGDFTVSARQSTTRLVGTGVGKLQAGQTLPVILRLQPIGAIQGVVFDTNGSSLLAGVQVRILSRERGILTQVLTGAEGSFRFDTLPISDGPFTLDAFYQGRLRARVPGLTLAQANQVLTRNITLGTVGTVAGRVRDASGAGYADARVKVQSLAFLNLFFEVTTDSAGNYRAQGVPVGDFEVIATTLDNRVGRALGRINIDNENVNLDVVLSANGLSGTVFQRDGVTPVGAGVSVYLAPYNSGPQYSYANALGVVQTQTDAQGRYGFNITAVGRFYIQAEKLLERGRSETVILSLGATQSPVVDVVYLSKGTVSGVIRDSSGAVQPNAAVTVRTDGAFVAERSAQADAQGRYTMPGVFVGDVTVSARNTITRLAGYARARLLAEGNQVAVDVTLQATGRITGRVLDADGSSVPTAVRLQLRAFGGTFSSIELPNGNSFTVDLIPLGNVEIFAERVDTGSRGRAYTRISAAGDVRDVSVRLTGVGSIRVTLLDANAQPVSGAKVTASTQIPFAFSQQIESTVSGVVQFDNVPAGDFSLSALKSLLPSPLTGNASGTLLPNELKSVTIQMTSQPTGTIRGVLYKPDGVTPFGSGMVIRMQPEPFLDAYVATTGAGGVYQFNNVVSGTYIIDALRFYLPNNCPALDRVRGRATGVTLATQGQVVTSDIQLIGAGIVRGRVTDGSNAGVGGIRVTLTNPDPIYGLNVRCDNLTTYDATTDSAGNYQFFDAPPGNFTIVAQNTDGTLRAEGADRVKFDTDEVVLNLSLISNAVTMPYTFHDANGFKFDVTGTGALGTGTNSVFASPSPNTAGIRLEVSVSGAMVPFANGDGTIGKLSASGQTIELDEVAPSGLNVTRRITTLRAGYYTRYLEVLENRTLNPITVDVQIKTHHRSANANPRVVDTSDGDQVLSIADANNPDRWAIVDDQIDADPFDAGGGSIPATGHVFDGAGAARRTAVASYELIGATGLLTYRWNAVTVPANRRVILMHFAFNQLDRQAARQAALRLSQLPPEAIVDLTTDERNDVANFRVPTVSVLSALPNLDAGLVKGRTLSGDGATLVPGAAVLFQSQHPLFGRKRRLDSNAQGEFKFQSTLDGTQNNYVIPVYNFRLSAIYQPTGATTSSTVGQFPTGQTQVTQDLIFNNTGDVRGVITRHSGQTVSGTNIRLCRVDDPSLCSGIGAPANYTISAADGSYKLLANEPFAYTVLASKPHPQDPVGFGGRPLLGRQSVTVTAGDTVVANVVLEPTGSIAGVVRDQNGSPLVNAIVTLYLPPGFAQAGRQTRTDTSGAYRLSDVPLGNFRIVARDASTNASATGDTTVALDAEATLNLQVSAFGGFQVQVKFARGANAAGSRVECVDTSSCTGGIADSNGRLFIQVAAGSYRLRAIHPDRPNNSLDLTTELTATLTQNSTTVPVTINLPPAGSVAGRIVRPDGTTAANGFPFSIEQISGAGGFRSGSLSTTPKGTYQQNGLGLGRYLIVAYDAAQDRYADAEFEITGDDVQTIVDLTLLDNRIALPANLLDANRFKADVQRNGSLASGTAVFNNAAVSLAMNGQPYVGETSARLEASRRQFRIAQIAPIAGLQVERKIYVPRGAYFTRYLEILKNPTGAAVTVQVALTSKLKPTQVLATSSGDTTVGNGDLWVSFDDAIDEDYFLNDGQVAPTGFVHGGAGGLLPQLALTSGAAPELSQTWANVTVPANGQITLMHFVVQQINRGGIGAAMARLTLLPPEVLSDLSTLERSSLMNFVLPPNGQNTQPALPPLTASITGVAYEGDVRTPVRGARISVQSSHPLFNRVWGLRRDSLPDCTMVGTVVPSLLSLANPVVGSAPLPAGYFTISGQLTANDSIALPEGIAVRLTAQEPRGCFGQYSGHSFTGVPSRVETFNASSAKDLVWDTGVITGSAVGSSDFQVTSGRMFLSVDDPDPPASQYTPIGSDGTFVYPGLRAGSYDLLFDTRHHDGLDGDRLRGARKAQALAVGQVLVADIQMQPTGRVLGAILSANGEALVNARIQLLGEATGQNYDHCAQGCVPDTLQKHKSKAYVGREIRTDSLGRYSFGAVPDGAYQLKVLDPISGATKVLPLTVTSNQSTVQNVTMVGLGSAQLTLTSPQNAPVSNAFVYLFADLVGTERVAGRTNPQGQLSIANIPEGSYVLRVIDPRYPDRRAADQKVQGSVTTNGQANIHTARLRAFARLTVTVVDGDNAGAPVVGAQVKLTDTTNELLGGSTNAQGIWAFETLAEGDYVIDARAVITGVPRAESVSGTVLQTQDQQAINVSIDLRGAVVQLPVTLFDANRFPYVVGANAASSSTPELSIDSTAFTGSASGRRELAQRQYVVAQANALSGLRVTRKAFTPINGYFVRYLEILENPTAASISVSVSLRTESQFNRAITDTSSGDAILDASDRWAVLSEVPNYTAEPSGAFVVAGSNVGLVAPILSFSAQGTSPSITSTWPAITVPANQSVVLLHFAVKQLNRAGAKAAAERLAQLPPEALIGIAPSDIALIKNFTIPANLQSSLPELPLLNGAAQGRLLQGDGVTPIANQSVTAQSQHPLFSRVWNSQAVPPLQTNASGEFAIVGAVNGNNQNIALPIGAPIVLNAYVSGLTQTVTLTPTANAPIAIGNMIAATGSMRGVVSGAYNEAISGDVQFLSVGGSFSAPLLPDGSYLQNGLPAGNYEVRARVNGGGNFVQATVNGVAVTLGNQTVQNIVLPANGRLQGVLRKADGSILANQLVRLFGVTNPAFNAQFSTDAQGAYRYGLLAPGSYLISVSYLQVQAQATAVIVANATTMLDLSMPATGAVTITVKFANGNPAVGTNVRLSAAQLVGERDLGNTDANGVLVANDVPLGALTATALRPLTGEASQVQGNLLSAGSNLALNLTLKASASLRLTVRDGAAANAPVANAVVSYVAGAEAGSAPNTDAAGVTNLLNLKQRTYTYRAVAPGGRVAIGSVTVDASVDGQVINKDLIIGTNVDQAGTLTFANESRLFGTLASAGDVLQVRLTSTAACGVNVTVLNDAFVAMGSVSAPAGALVSSSSIAITQNGPVAFAVTSGSCVPAGFTFSVTVNGGNAPVGAYVNSARVIGRVLRADGATAVPNTPVRAKLESYPYYLVGTTSDASGNFAFDAAPVAPAGAPSQLRVYRPDNDNGAIGGTMLVLLPNVGATVTQDLRLYARTTVNAQVRNADGSPWVPNIPGPMLVIDGDQRSTAAVDSQGRASVLYVGNAPGLARADMSTDGSLYAEATLTPADNQVVALDLFAAASAVDGVLQSIAGQPIANRQVAIYRDGLSQPYGSVTTNALGQYRFDNLPRSANMRLVAYDDQTQSEQSVLVTTGIGNTVTQNLQFARATLTGVISTPAGQPLIASVQVRYGPATISSLTDGLGRYTFSNLPPGRELQLSASLAVLSGDPVEASAVVAPLGANATATRNLQLTPPAGEVLHITAEIADSQPAPDGFYCFLNASQGANSTSGSACLAGVNAFYGLSPGAFDWTMSYEGGGFGFTSRSFTGTVSAGQLATASFLWSIVKGSISNANGAPATQVSVTLDARGIGVSDTGQYRAFAVPAGPFTLRVNDPNTGYLQTIVSQISDPRTPVVINLTMPATSIVKGTVRGAGGQVVTGANVYVDNGQFALWQATDSQGNYQFNTVSAGAFTISAVQGSSTVQQALVVPSTSGTLTVDLNFPTIAHSGAGSDHSAKLYASAAPMRRKQPAQALLRSLRKKSSVTTVRLSP